MIINPLIKRSGTVRMQNQKENWELSYQNKDNFVFYPHEEIIRFFSKYISKRIGLNDFIRKNNTAEIAKVLDLGCGIGRHIIFTNTMQAEAYGIDLSEEAIRFARTWGEKEGIKNTTEKIVQGDITKMPFADMFFDFIISHGVLDSMSVLNATNAVKDAARVLKTGGLFYCDLISGDDAKHQNNFSGEEIVDTDHEKGTIQLYYNDSLIDQVFGNYFSIQEKVLIKRINIHTGEYYSRYHLVLKRTN